MTEEELNNGQDLLWAIQDCERNLPLIQNDNSYSMRLEYTFNMEKILCPEEKEAVKALKTAIKTLFIQAMERSIKELKQEFEKL